MLAPFTCEPSIESPTVKTRIASCEWRILKGDEKRGTEYGVLVAFRKPIGNIRLGSNLGQIPTIFVVRKCMFHPLSLASHQVPTYDAVA
jgi:hypothetical protein